MSFLKIWSQMQFVSMLETSLDMTNRNISIIIKTKVTSNGINLSLI